MHSESVYVRGSQVWWRRLVGWIAAIVLLGWRLTFRLIFVDDPRPALRAAGRTYVYAILHAHQLAAALASEDHLVAMVSRSVDGELLIPLLRVRNVGAVRGSSRAGQRDKGGRTALAELTEVVRGGVHALFAVDGPRGPRGQVHRGIADLSLATGAPILPVVCVPARRWVLRRTWDLFQIPLPFTTIRLVFAPPIEARPNETSNALRDRVAATLSALEAAHDPEMVRSLQSAARAPSRWPWR